MTMQRGSARLFTFLAMMLVWTLFTPWASAQGVGQTPGTEVVYAAVEGGVLVGQVTYDEDGWVVSGNEAIFWADDTQQPRLVHVTYFGKLDGKAFLVFMDGDQEHVETLVPTGDPGWWVPIQDPQDDPEKWVNGLGSIGDLYSIDCFGLSDDSWICVIRISTTQVIMMHCRVVNGEIRCTKKTIRLDSSN